MEKENFSNINNKKTFNIDTTYISFLDSILKPDTKKALGIAKNSIKSRDDIQLFWEAIILPALYEVGEKWSKSDISVGEEHMATSICLRVMSEYYGQIIKSTNNKCNILIINGKDELHEVGSIMLADILELNGYSTYLLGSRYGIDEIYEHINSKNIKYLLISSALKSNIENIKEVIKQIKKLPVESIPEIIIGGNAFSSNENAVKEIGADKYLKDSTSLIKYIEESIK